MREDINYRYKEPSSEEGQTNSGIIPNNKPAISMKIAGGIIDISLIFLATFGFHSLITSTPMGQTLTNYRNEMINVQDEYKLQTLVAGSDETYGHKAYEGSDEFVTYSNYLHHEDEVGTYVVVNNKDMSQSIISAFREKVLADQRYTTSEFNYRFIDFGYLALASGVAEIILIIVVPLINKRRSTLGRLFAGTQLINSKYLTPVRWYQLIGRFFFIYLVETILPYLGISNWLVVLIVPLIVFIISLFNKDNRTITDYVTRSKLIDKRTYTSLTDNGGK